MRGYGRGSGVASRFAGAVIAVIVCAGATAGCVSTSGGVSVSASPTVGEGPLREPMAAISARLLASKAVAAYKAARGVPISDPQREAEVIASAAKTSAEKGVDVARAQKVVSDQIQASKIVQEGFQALWRESQGTPPANPSLEQARETITAATTAIVGALGRPTICPIEGAAVARIVAELHSAGLDSATSDRAVRTATASLCAG